MDNDNLTNFPLFDNCISKIKDVSGNGNISVPRELKQAISMQLDDELAKSLDGYFRPRAISSMGKIAIHVLVLIKKMSMMNASMKSLNFSRPSFNSNSSEQQRSQCFGVTKL